MPSVTRSPLTLNVLPAPAFLFVYTSVHVALSPAAKLPVVIVPNAAAVVSPSYVFVFVFAVIVIARVVSVRFAVLKVIVQPADARLPTVIAYVPTSKPFACVAATPAPPPAVVSVPMMAPQPPPTQA